jgi:hypothetical protein
VLSRRFSVGIIILAVLVAVAIPGATSATAAASSQSAGSVSGADGTPPTNCLWSGLIDSSIPQYNFAFPDAGAIYWTAQISLPAGSNLFLLGRYPHARYMSLNSYSSAAAPTDDLYDAEIHPAPGSHNPFLPGANRDAKSRRYVVRVVGTPPPAGAAQRSPNTLYAGVAGQTEQVLIYRVYVPDHGTGTTGGVGLPTFALQLADGRLLVGASACAALSAKQGAVPESLISPSQYAALRDQPGKPPTFPATNPPTWHRFFNSSATLSCLYQLAPCVGSPPDTGGQYSNVNNRYVLADVNLGFGQVLVLRGKLPTTPQTVNGEGRMGSGQMRYWSICQNQSVATTAGGACLYDEEVPITSDREYTIVTSQPGDRPTNATASCGVGYIPWVAGGDGAGHPDEAYLILRNMLPAASFHHAVQDVTAYGQEKAVMGPYLPGGTYMSKAQFEKLGCPA